MSAFGPKRTWARALHMSAFGGKADIAAAPPAFDPTATSMKTPTLDAAEAYPLSKINALKGFLCIGFCVGAICHPQGETP